MRALPSPEPAQPGPAALASPSRFLLWTARLQWGTLAAGAVLGAVWMLAQALVPWALGHAVDDGLGPRDVGAVARWASVLAGLLLVQAGFGTARHRFAVSSWLQASLGTSQLVGHHVGRVGAALPQRLPTGEVVSTVATDAVRLGNVYEVVPRFAGALVAFAVVAVLLLERSVTLGLVVLLGVPLTGGLLAVVVRPLQRRQAVHRTVSGELTTLGADTVAGLRVLRGVGGEGVFLRRYTERSQQVRRAGTEVAAVQATLDALQVLLPGAFVVLVTWLGARAAATGQLTAGDVVAFYGYAAFLVVPLRTATDMLERTVSGHVSARRVLAVLAVRPAAQGPGAGTVTAEPPPGSGLLHDPTSGLAVRPKLLTALVAADSGPGLALAARLGRLDDTDDGDDGDDGEHGRPPVTLGGVALRDLPVATVRRRVVVAAGDAVLFTGTLRSALDPYRQHPDAALLRALATACAHDVLDGLPRGLDDEITERGRSLSGGQRQRLVLARALLRDPDVLVLVEPTSAVDAHTEAAVAARLRVDRAGRATVVLTTSPLLLARADEVAFLDGGRVVGSGTHHELAHRPDAVGRLYRRTVLRTDLTGPGAAAGAGAGDLPVEVAR